MQDNNLDERLVGLERKAAFFQGALAVLGALGIGVALWVNFLSEKMPSESRISEIKRDIDSHAEAVMNDPLRSSFSERSILAQVSAQAACVALAPPGTTVQAVHRGVTSVVDGIAYSEICPKICGRLVPEMVGTGKPGSFVGGLHIYPMQKPFTVDSSETFSKGMATHRYTASDSNDQFGPNYCCCAG